MKDINLKVLLIGGLFFTFLTNQANAKTLYKDAFIYKVSDEVYSLKDLQIMADNLNSLNCYYKDSLLTKVFKGIYTKGSSPKLYVVKDYTKTPYSESQKEIFKKMVLFHKLKFYSDSHKVNVKPSVIKAFYLASRQLGCSGSIFISSSEFTKNFESMMKMELFLRSRYLPEEKSGKNTEADNAQAVKSIKTLLTSIDKQISEETYW